MHRFSPIVRQSAVFTVSNEYPLDAIKKQADLLDTIKDMEGES
ncbi:hypothetical protein B0G69_6618 [Paraburkholderia sp. RAU2J]|nr:hypothetical protein [Paraburkholderia sp. RAU2J]RKT13464.1 hypothetical protein B0G69_6618 [Paraburkholderia sp. RAU2J]